MVSGVGSRVLGTAVGTVSVVGVVGVGKEVGLSCDFDFLPDFMLSSFGFFFMLTIDAPFVLEGADGCVVDGVILKIGGSVTVASLMLGKVGVC